VSLPCSATLPDAFPTEGIRSIFRRIVSKKIAPWWRRCAL